MLRPRIIPCILIDNDDVVKTINFNEKIYIGDPLNIVRLFNDKKCDEILILDISATEQNREPNFKLIKNISEVARMPVAYGGGVKSEKQALEIFSSGIEKISVNSLFFENKEEIKKIINSVGSQSLVVTFDIKKIKNNYHIVSHRGKFFVTDNIHSTIERAEQIGVGEIIINNVDRDGTMIGYDDDLIKIFYESTSIPITILGGAGKTEHISNSIKKYGSIVRSLISNTYYYYIILLHVGRMQNIF